MNSTLKQDTRIAQLTTPLGKDVLVLVRFDATEALSELFEYRIEALSERELELEPCLGRACSVTIKSYGQERHFSGLLAEAQWTGIKYEHHLYRLVLRPWFWILTRTTNCRFFQDKTAPDILKEVLKGGDVRFVLNDGPYPKLEYCVQYRETDFAFASRLMEHHGIYYFFKHTSDNHTLVVVDSMSSHEPIPGLASIPFIPLGNPERRDRQHIYHWISEHKFRTGKVELNDYYELNPTADLKAKKDASAKYDKKNTEFYDYPGKYRVKSDGEKYAKVALEADQALDGRRHTAGNAVSLFPGGLIKIQGHPHPKQSENDKDYLVVRSSHAFVVERYRSDPGLGDEGYSGNFELLPKEGKVFRAQITTPKPLIHGLQTAKVVGPQGEEIHVDEHGRIKVEFFWDRDKKQSCWIRVAEVWAGKKWGGQFIPRIGMEAVVEFLEGDPDRPLVTGAVYNRDYQHPYDLPSNKTQSGIKSDSSRGSGGYNQFRFEDNKRFEEIHMQAEKDHNVKVKHAETWEIGEKFEAPTGLASRQVSIKMGDDKLKLDPGSRDVDIALMDQLKAGLLIQMQCGGSKITMTPVSISIEAPIIMLSGALIKIN
jgi:type VI secretion system secreted protein VgrG